VNGPFEIKTLTAFIMRDNDGTEGIIGLKTPDGWMPCVGADEDRIRSLEPTVRMMVNAMGVTATLARFSVREDIKQIEPNRSETKDEAVDLGNSIVGIREKSGT
jgi:hypothetical protein